MNPYNTGLQESGFDKKIQAEAAENGRVLLYSLSDIVGKKQSGELYDKKVT